MADQRDKNAKHRSGDDQQDDLERALQPEHAEDLLGQMEENTNLTGSTTWETLGDNREGSEPQSDADADAERRSERAQRAQSGRQKQGSQQQGNREQSAPQPPRTTKGGITSPKFGSAGSGGAELEPGPEVD
jgi:hypothetical protein